MRREFLYGFNCVSEALAGRRRILRLFITPSRMEHPGTKALLDRAAAKGVPFEVVDEAKIRSRVGNVNHQGIVAEALEFPYVSFGEIADCAGPQSLLLVLDHLEDPQNVATLLRTAEACGVVGILLPRRRSAAITPAVSHASSGAVEHLRVALVSNIPSSIRELKSLGLWAVGLENRVDAIPIWLADLSGGLALVIGSEGRGLSSLVVRECDFLIKIPMLGKVTSLNAAIAGSLALYEALRQRYQAVGQNLFKI